MPARARLDYQALRHNLTRVRELAPAVQVMAVIKANAYGHGLLGTARALDDADALAVARLEEAIQIRQASISKRIVVLEGVTSREELLLANQQGFDIVVHALEQVQLLEAVSLASPQHVWLKQDTGMHRLGFDSDLVAQMFQRLEQGPNQLGISLMSHLANADDPGDPLTELQLQALQATGTDLGVPMSLANSAGICGPVDCQLDWVRPGIMLYGVHPLQNCVAEVLDLKPVMTLSANIITIQQRRKGDAIGYGGSWVCPEDMPVGVIDIGYGDGYPRHACSGTPVLVNGVQVPLVGRVSMDMICVDLRSCPAARVRDEVILWGQGLPIEQVARAADTIAYELTCRLTSRVRFE